MHQIASHLSAIYSPVVFLHSTWYFFFFILTILVATETLISLMTREDEYLHVYLSMRDISCLQVGILNIVKLSVFFKFIYRSDTFPIILTSSIFSFFFFFEETEIVI